MFNASWSQDVSSKKTIKYQILYTTGPVSKKDGGGKKRSKKSSILAQGPPMTGTRKSSRKRLAPSWGGEAPLASSTLTAAALGRFGTLVEFIAI